MTFGEAFVIGLKKRGIRLPPDNEIKGFVRQCAIEAVGWECDASEIEPGKESEMIEMVAAGGFPACWDFGAKEAGRGFSA